MARRITLILLGAASLAACGREPTRNDQAADAAVGEEQAGSEESAGSVTRTDVSATPEPAPPAAPAVIQEQPGPKGARVALNRVAVTGDVLTVQLTYSGASSCCSYVPIERVSVIDDATAQQIGVLKDGQGRWLAAPIGHDVDEVRIGSHGETPQIVWFKFPAPPPTSSTVSINIPEVGPFDGVPVTR